MFGSCNRIGILVGWRGWTGGRVTGWTEDYSGASWTLPRSGLLERLNRPTADSFAIVLWINAVHCVDVALSQDAWGSTDGNPGGTLHGHQVCVPHRVPQSRTALAQVHRV